MRELKLFNQLHDYPIILARRIGKSSSGMSNRFVGLTSRFNTTIEINPPYPQAAELRTWIKTIETKLVAYKMKSTTPIGFIMLIPFEDEVIYMANIQAQPPVGITNVKKRTIEHLSSGEKEYPSMENKYNPSTHKHSMKMKNPPMKKN
ncbi:hypothetical protein MTR67_040141 [Solanum verrucosum]|uniref:Uncharacterized protein n=1 Tax=Solanum verrucosum TaxID=315347 RepID=A0AAF0ZPI4_SOLVR|nr:hypothetical protein MTR67_040141 [Solanum verrucosum]